MRRAAFHLAFVFLAVAVAAAGVAAGPARVTGEFSATASVDTNQGTRSMGFNLVVSNPITMEQAQPLKDVLAHGGQQALLNAIRGSARGKIRLGGFEYPVDLVVVEPSGDVTRYYVVTARSLKYEEVNEGRPSLDHPFSVFVVNVPGMGTGDGRIYTQAALSIDEEGHVRADQYDGRPGTLRDVKRLK
ncbi:MAG TPA: hypothetical protein VKG23_17190 [Thermoanaerobaculia bacterium]|nr:hypothetical protein [Thermoanaerobaculia bacterium]